MKLKNKQIAIILRKAYLNYVMMRHYGMCPCIVQAIVEIHDHKISAEEITDYVPNFTPEFFGVEPREYKSYSSYWWEIDDRNSRYMAFQKIIRYYEFRK